MRPSPEPDGRGDRGDAARGARRRAGRSVGEVDHVNAHGTGTPQNDRAEAAGLRLVFGERRGALPVNSIKSMVGHCLGAAGAIEAAALALTIARGVIPPTIHHHAHRRRMRSRRRPQRRARGGRSAAASRPRSRSAATTQRWSCAESRRLLRLFSSSLASTSAVALLAAGVFVFAVSTGSTVAGGSDSSGYLSEAVTLARGRWTQDRPLARRVPWPGADWTLAPLGWRKGLTPGIIAPTYPSGYPLVMAAAHVVAGPRAMFWIVPALAALAVWCTFVLGRRTDGDLTGVFAAGLLATSPPFVFQTLQPMSDVPATAWWTAAIALAAHGSPAALVGSGVAAGAAVLTRPNLVPIGAAIGVFLIARDWGTPRDWRRVSAPLLFALPLAAACVGVAWLQNHLYGSPILSGYGPAGQLYALEHATPNLQHYARWLSETETPLVLAGLIAPIVFMRRRGSTPIPPSHAPSRPAGFGATGDRERMRLAVLGVAVILLVFASYLFYSPFDNWSFLRFLLPAYPMLFVLAVAAFRHAAASLGARGAIALTSVVCAVILSAHVRTIRVTNALDIRSSEMRYEQVARFVADRVPGRAAVIALQHTGSIAYYAERPTIRWNVLNRDWLDETIEFLRERGYRPLILLDDWEERDFKARYAGESFGKLDWPAHAELPGPVQTRIYDPDDRTRFLAGHTWTTEPIR